MPRGTGQDSEADRDVDLDLLEELSRVNNELLSTQRVLARRTAELDRAVDRMNQLLGMAAHDLRNPIGSVRGLAQTLLLRAQDRLEPQEVVVLERIEQTCDRMLRLVHDLLDLSEAEHGQAAVDPGPVDLRAVVREVLDVAGIAARDKDIHLELDAPDPGRLEGDADQLDELVANLVSNAIKYSHRGGHVRLELRDDDETVRLRVTDDGVGIDQQEHESIFHPFGKGTAPPTEGESRTGLGLAIARRIAAAHGGTLTVASARGAGATFTLTLPRVVPSPT